MRYPPLAQLKHPGRRLSRFLRGLPVTSRYKFVFALQTDR
jgi:hypothetical protein